MKTYKIEGYGVFHSFSELYEIVHEKYVKSKRDWVILTKLERRVLLARWFEMEITGSGVISIFFGSIGDYLAEFFDMLEHIEAKHTLDHMKKLEGLFGANGIPSEIEQRESRYFEIDENLDGVLQETIDVVDEYLFSGRELIEQLLIDKLSAV
ncbi:MAG: DMP19 family protein [Bacteroidota bacterium]